MLCRLSHSLGGIHAFAKLLNPSVLIVALPVPPLADGRIWLGKARASHSSATGTSTRPATGPGAGLYYAERGGHAAVHDEHQHLRAN